MFVTLIISFIDNTVKTLLNTSEAPLPEHYLPEHHNVCHHKRYVLYVMLLEQLHKVTSVFPMVTNALYNERQHVNVSKLTSRSYNISVVYVYYKIL